MLASTDGLPGPVTVNRFGKPDRLEPEVRARAVGPHVAQRERRRGHGCRCGASAPVMASKPVANTMTSRSKWPCAVWMPVWVIASMAPWRRSTRVTLSRLKVSK